MGAFLRLAIALLIVPAVVFSLIHFLPPPQTPGKFALQTLVIIAIGVLVTSALALEFHRHTTVAGIAVVGVTLFTLMAIAINVYLPGGSFVFFWLPLFVAMGVLLVPWVWPNGWLGADLTVIAAAPILLLGAPLALTLFTALTLNLAWAPSVLVVLFTFLTIGAFAAVVPPAEPRTPNRVKPRLRLKTPDNFVQSRLDFPIRCILAWN